MPDRSRVEALVALVKDGAYVEAIEYRVHCEHCRDYAEPERSHELSYQSAARATARAWASSPPGPRCTSR